MSGPWRSTDRCPHLGYDRRGSSRAITRSRPAKDKAGDGGSSAGCFNALLVEMPSKQ